MAKITFSLILILSAIACGKKGDIPVNKIDINDRPAIIDKERIYKF